LPCTDDFIRPDAQLLGMPLSPSEPKRAFQAGHTPYTASWTSTLTRSGQIHSWRAATSPNRSRGGPPIPTHLRPPWNERIPVWERRIPHYDDGRAPSPYSVSPPPSRGSTFNPYGSEASLGKGSASHIVTRDWSLLFSPGRVDTLIRRPWPEYEPESSAAVGRRWHGCNLGRLYEHVLPAGPQPATPMTTSMVPPDSYQ